jgi:N-methylhydantoinase A
MLVSTDVGGTFTDFIEVEEGKLNAFKLLSSKAIDEVIKKEISNKSLDFFSHGTTTATNTILERKGAKTALITTKGFGDVIQIGRQARSKLYSLAIARPSPLVSKVYEIDERINSRGEVIKPINPEELKAIEADLEARGFESIAVCFLFSFSNSAHEKRVKQSPNLPVSMSSEVLREYREYERASTTVLDAYVKPVLNHYFNGLKKIKELPPDLWVMQSNGGVQKIEELTPVNALLSGPAGGVAASKWIAELLELKDLITFDMGGTSTDVSTLLDRKALMTNEGSIEGYPVAVPMVDIVTIGAGGGSIAWLDEGGALRIGPQSAGAEPGPICYDKRGSQLTVTDANLLLGYLGEEISSLKLNKEKAEKAAKLLAKNWRIGYLDLLQGVQKIVNFNMGEAIKKITLQRGLDPRDFCLIAYGGAGPMHACQLTKDIGIREIIVPPYPGAFSAFGILASPFTKEFSESHLTDLEKQMDFISSKLREFYRRGAKVLKNFGLKQAIYLPSLDLRYKGQAYSLSIPLRADEVELKQIEQIEEKFHRAHRNRYGYSSKALIELVNVRLRIEAERLKLKLPRIDQRKPIFKGERICLFEGEEYRTPVFGGRARNFQQAGPVIIEDDTATVVVPPSFHLEMDEFGIIYIKRG